MEIEERRRSARGSVERGALLTAGGLFLGGLGIRLTFEVINAPLTIPEIQFAREMMMAGLDGVGFVCLAAGLGKLVKGHAELTAVTTAQLLRGTRTLISPSQPDQ